MNDNQLFKMDVLNSTQLYSGILRVQKHFTCFNSIIFFVIGH